MKQKRLSRDALDTAFKKRNLAILQKRHGCWLGSEVSCAAAFLERIGMLKPPLLLRRDKKGRLATVDHLFIERVFVLCRMFNAERSAFPNLKLRRLPVEFWRKAVRSLL